jgi:3-hydroxymyristoyl/3-hydroxydecanoyl-(acyl carrier protein) dehydratase
LIKELTNQDTSSRLQIHEADTLEYPRKATHKWMRRQPSVAVIRFSCARPIDARSQQGHVFIMLVNKGCVQTAEVSPSHPALAGHFSGNPIVPGALILTYVQEAAVKATGGYVIGVMLAKFHAPLKPAQPFKIELQANGPEVVRFRVMTGEILVANGDLRVTFSR